MMDKERLLYLADHLDRIPRKAFDMRAWIKRGPGDPGTWTDPTLTQGDVALAEARGWECGMTACIGGHAAALFPDRLLLDQGSLKSYDSDGPNGWGSGAFANAFGICVDHAIDLVACNAPHRTARQAARAIRALVRENPGCCRWRP